MGYDNNFCLGKLRDKRIKRLYCTCNLRVKATIRSRDRKAWGMAQVSVCEDCQRVRVVFLLYIMEEWYVELYKSRIPYNAACQDITDNRASWIFTRNEEKDAIWRFLGACWPPERVGISSKRIMTAKRIYKRRIGDWWAMMMKERRKCHQCEPA